jgi:hypothetical protein
MKHPMRAMLAAALSLAAVSAQAAQPQGAGEEDGFAAAAIVPDATLASQRGGTDPGIACTNCIANGVSTISDNAFQNAIGVFTIIQNTGNQVFLNTVTVVNVSITN